MTKTPQKIDASSPYALFETNTTIEREGVRLDYGPFYVQVARAGGANSRFRDILRQRLAPHQRAIDTGVVSDALVDRLTIDVFAETVVVGWGSEKYGDGKIVGRAGEEVPFSVENVKQLFKDLPDLARDIVQQATNQALFRANVAALDAGN